MKDAATFFETELTGPTWTFGPQQAAAITCPVLSVLGSRSSPLFVEGRQLLHAWFPACQDADIAGATHLLQMQAPGPVAAAMRAGPANRQPVLAPLPPARLKWSQFRAAVARPGVWLSPRIVAGRTSAEGWQLRILRRS